MKLYFLSEFRNQKERKYKCMSDVSMEEGNEESPAGQIFNDAETQDDCYRKCLQVFGAECVIFRYVRGARRD